MARVWGPKIDASHPATITPPSSSPREASPFYPDTPPLSTVSSETNLDLKLSSSSVSVEDEPLIAVIGVGYVGTHLVSSFSSRYKVVGFDVSEKRLNQLRGEFSGNESVYFSRDHTDLIPATHFLISVPTLLRPDKTIDSSYLRDALRMVSKVARRGSTVVIESSVAVGMTRQLLGPIAASKGLFAGMSPERVNPGRVEPPVHSIPKIISGLDDVLPGSLDAISRVYSTIFENVVAVSKPEVAEMMKLYENCQRMVCIAYANEMADACVPHGIDPFEVCAAAGTKPFGYMPYAPGLGVGGHCIPVNPFYLLSNNSFPLLEACSVAMNNRPAKLAKRLLSSLQREPAGTKATPRVLIVGMGFKAGQSHLVNSPGLDMARNLAVSQEVEVMWADALVKQESIPQIPKLADEEWTKENLETF